MSREKSITDAHSFKIDSLTRKMRRYSANVLKNKGVDVTIDQWGALGLLYESKNAINQTELASLLIKDTPTTSRILDILCKKKYVERRPNPKDRRKFDVVLTPKGKKLVKTILPIVEEIRRNVFAGLTEKELEKMTQIIQKIEKNIE